MKRTEVVLALVYGLLPGSAIACGGWYDVACNVGKTIEKAVQDTGKTVEKAVHDTGSTLEKAVQDTGKTLENAAHDTGHAFEKAGQDIGSFFTQAINFKLDCSLPSSKPADIDEVYREQCSNHLSTYRSDIDMCNNIGGASMIAAGTAGAIVSAAYTAGATYVLAKLAFETCQQACRSKASLDQCVASVDFGAQDAAERSAMAQAANDRLEQLFTCMDDAYAAETILMADSILTACEAQGGCSTASSQFNEEFLKEVEDLRRAISIRREQAKLNMLSGSSAKNDYGPFLQSPSLTNIKIISPGNDAPACRAASSKIVLRADFSNTNLGTIKVNWLRQGSVVTTSDHAVAENYLEVEMDLASYDPGVWEASLVSSDGQSMGSFGFVYRPERQ